MSTKRVVPRPNHGVRVPPRWIDGAGGPSANHLRQSRWQDQGACADQDTEAWFVRNEGSHFSEPAKQVCAHCPVQRDCLASALLFGEQHGVWGGLDRHQRHALTLTLRLGATLGSALDQGLGVQSAGMDAA
jgi:WhiB family redox-sensing transcriptional regulator